MSSQVVSIATGATLEELVKQVELMHRQKPADEAYNSLFKKKKDPVKDYLLKSKVPFVVVERQWIIEIK